jgi:hypothetical protein
MHFIKNNHKVFLVILLGFFLFGLKDFAELLSHTLQRALALVGMVFIFGAPFFLKYKIVNPLKGRIRILFYAYLWWIVFMIFRPIFSGQEFSEWNFYLGNPYGLTSYFLPFVVLLGIRIISLPKFFKIIFVFSIIGFVFFALNFNTMQAVVLRGITMSLDGEIGLGDLANRYYYWFSISSLSLLCYEFVDNRYKWFAVFTSLFMLFLLAYFARRSGVFMFVLYFLGMFYLYLEQSKSRYQFVKILLVLAIISITFVTVTKYSDSTFSILFNRLDDDSRSDVDETIIKYLTTENAWLFGKGIDGAYKHPAFDLPRYTHETGYLYLILKGGIINLFFYVSLLLHAAYMGFFKTRNRLTKALALYVFFHVVFLIPFGVPSFDLEYLLVWIAFALCESSIWRLMTNQQIKQHLAKINII